MLQSDDGQILNSINAVLGSNSGQACSANPSGLKPSVNLFVDLKENFASFEVARHLNEEESRQILHDNNEGSMNTNPGKSWIDEISKEVDITPKNSVKLYSPQIQGNKNRFSHHLHGTRVFNDPTNLSSFEDSIHSLTEKLDYFSFIDLKSDCHDGFSGIFSTFTESLADDYPKAEQYHFLSINDIDKSVPKLNYLYNLLSTFNSSIAHSFITLPINFMKEISMKSQADESVHPEEININNKRQLAFESAAIIDGFVRVRNSSKKFLVESLNKYTKIFSTSRFVPAGLTYSDSNLNFDVSETIHVLYDPNVRSTEGYFSETRTAITTPILDRSILKIDKFRFTNDGSSMHVHDFGGALKVIKNIVSKDINPIRQDVIINNQLITDPNSTAANEDQFCPGKIYSYSDCGYSSFMKDLCLYGKILASSRDFIMVNELEQDYIEEMIENVRNVLSIHCI